MIVFPQERKDAINKMKAYVVDTVHVSHEDFVLYAALRGQDIRKTSHQPDGANALSALRRLERYYQYRIDKNIKDPQYLINKEQGYVLHADDFPWIMDVLKEAKHITELTPEANDGVNTMAMN